MSWDLPKEIAQEEDDLELGNVLPMEVQVESQVLSSEADSHGGDSRDPVVAVAMLDDGGLGPRRPSAPEGGGHEKTALVQEGPVRPQPLGFFLIAVPPAAVPTPPSSFS